MKCTACVLPVVEILEARIAPASYAWNVDADGEWRNAANWLNQTTGQANDGFPNGSTDTASFLAAISAPRVVTIAMGSTITVGALAFDSAHDYTIAASASGGIMLDAPSGNAGITMGSLGGMHTIDAPLVLADSLTITNGAGGKLIVAGAVSESNAGKGITVDGVGVVQFAGATSNAYTGATVVATGTLELGKANGAVAVAGNLSVGSVGSATLRLLGSELIANSATVSIGAGGTFDLNDHDETIGALSLASGATVASRVTTGIGTLTLGGSVTLNLLSGGGATANVSGKLHLGNSTRTFFVADGLAATDLEIAATISGTGGAGLSKDGDGFLRMTGLSANTYTGATAANRGSLVLAKSDGVDAFAGRLVVGDPSGFGHGRVALGNSNNIPNNTAVTVNSDGVLDLNGFNDTVGPLTLIGDDLLTILGGKVQTGAGTLTLNGDVVVTGSLPGPAISGKLDLGAATRVFTIASTTALGVSAAISGVSVGLTLNGSGVLTLSGATANTFSGTTTINGGVLSLAKNAGTNALAGEVIIGDGAGFDTLRVSSSNNLSAATNIRINPGGALQLLGGNATIGALTMVAGGASSVGVDTGTNTLTLGGDVTVISGGTSAADATIVGKLSLGAAPRSFSVESGTAGLDIAATISGAAGGEMIKTGGGTLTFRPALASTYVGATTVNAGTLELAGADNVVAIPRRLIVNAAKVVLQSDGQIADAALIMLNTGATLDLNGRSETLGPLLLAGGSTIENGSLTLDDTLSLNLRPGAMPPRIDAALDLAGATLSVVVGAIPAPGETFTVLQKASAGAIASNFADAPQGGALQTWDGNFTINYAGGDGNDVVLSPIYIAPVITGKGRVAQFNDRDGDLVTLRVTQGAFAADQFLIFGVGNNGGGQLVRLDLSDPADLFAASKLTITAKKSTGGPGDNLVNIGAIDARGINLGAVNIAGDLGRIDVAAAKSLTVQSLGTLGLATQTEGGSTASHFTGKLGSLTVKESIRDASVLGSTSIGPVKVLGSILGGRISAGADLGAVSVRRDVIGTTVVPVVVSAFGKAVAPARGVDVAIKSLKVGGEAVSLRVLAGYDASLAGANADAAIGAITVGGDWRASTVLVGVSAGTNGLDGTSDDAKLTGAGVRDNPAILSRIASITIKNRALGTSDLNDSFGIVAEQISKAKVGGMTLPFKKGGHTGGDFFAIGENGDFAIGEATS